MNKYKKAKYYKIHIVVVLSIFVVNILILKSYQISYNNYINEDILKNNVYRTLIIGSSDNNKIRVEKLKNISNIVNIVPSNLYQLGLISKEMITSKFPGQIWIYNANNNSIPTVIDGTNFPDNDSYYMICPQNFYPTLNYEEMKYYSKYDSFNIKNILGKTIHFEYEVNGIVGNINIKVVGTYKNSNNFFDEYVCYVNEKTLKDIIIRTNIDENRSQLVDEYIIEIDNSNNLNKVESELEKLGYYYYPMAYTNATDTRKINVKIDWIIIISIILMLIFISYEINHDIKFNYFKVEDKNKICKDKVNITKNILKKYFKYFALSTILTMIFVVIFLIILYFWPFLLDKIPLKINICVILVLFLIYLFTLIVNIFFNLKRIK